MNKYMVSCPYARAPCRRQNQLLSKTTQENHTDEILHEFIYVNFKIRQSSPAVLKVRRAFGRPRRVDHEVKRLRPSWSIWWNPVSTKNTKKNSWAWWCVPVIPATPEAEAGESLESRRRGCSEPRLHHCTPTWWQSETPSQKQNKTNKTKQKKKLRENE